MKILHIINVRWFNATAWYAYRLARAGIRAGDEAVIAGLPGSPVIELAKRDGVPTFEADFNSNNIFKIIKCINKIKRFLTEYEPDVIVCHRGEMFIWFALYRYFRKPSWKLIRVRGDIRPPTKDIFSRFTHNKCADAIIVSADVIKNYFIKGLKTPSDHIATIYGGVDTAVFKPDTEMRLRKRAEFGYTDSDYVVSIVGRYDPVKGHKIFFDACSKLYHGGMKDLKLLVIGFPENIKDSDIKMMIDEGKIASIVTLTGKRSDVPALLNTADLGVIASLGSEAICRVAMEFMATGISVVASDAGVLPEMLPACNIYPMNDPNALAARIKSHQCFVKIYSSDSFYQQFKSKILSIS